MTTEQVTRPAAAVASGAGLGSGALSDWLQEVGALAKRWYLEVRRDRLNLLFTTVQPALWLVFFGVGVGRTVDKAVIGTSDYIGFMLPGIIAFTVVGNGVSAAMSLMWDKEGGYLDKLMSMPIARSSVIVSRFVFQMALNSAQIVVVLIVALIIGVDFEAGIAGALVIFVVAALLTIAATSAFSAIAYAVANHGTFFAVTGFINLPLLFMSNAFVPLDAMPGWMEVIARANPLTYAITAMRHLVIDGFETGVATNIGLLAVFSVACLAVGVDQFRRKTAERVS